MEMYILGLIVQYLSASVILWVIGFITFFIRRKGSEKRSMFSNVAGDLSIMIPFGLVPLIGSIYTIGLNIMSTVVIFASFTFGIFSYYYHKSKRSQ